MPSDKQIIHLYSICWNEEFMLPYFFNHYDQLVTKYVIYDNYSTDNTLTILHSHPNVEIKTFPNQENSFVLTSKRLHNSVWKESIGADWVIITAIDEFLYHPHLEQYLKECAKKGITAIPALGFQMVSEILPKPNLPIYEQITTGCPFMNMNKLSIFNPNKIIKTYYGEGRHLVGLFGEVVFPERDELLNLHYKNIGFEKTFKRNQELNNKLGKLDKERKWGWEYGLSNDGFRKEWDKLMCNAMPDVPSLTSQAHDIHSGKNDTFSRINKRWWRD